jgi:hypothetical protein
MASKLLIAGCSQAAGHEINGEQDCEYNRQHSFGNLLAQRLDREPVNVAQGGLSNAGIVRSVMTWFHEVHDPADDVAVLVAWSEACRLDIPQSPEVDYANPAADHYFNSHRDFLQVNISMEITPEMNENEQRNILCAQRFMIEQQAYCEIQTMQNIMMLQNYFAARGVQYLMCSTMELYNANSLGRPNKWTRHYLPFVNTDVFMDFNDPDAWFYWHYRNAGYENPLAKYWHHDEEPHALYADKLYDYVKTGNKLTSG